MHGSRGRVGLASCVLLTGLEETAPVGVTDVVAINLNTDTATVDIIVRHDGIVVAVPGAVVGVGEISLAPRAVELTISVPFAGLGERKLTVGGDADDSLVASLKIEKEPGVATGAGHVSLRSLPVISDFVPNCDGDCALGMEGDGVIMAVRVAVA